MRILCTADISGPKLPFGHTIKDRLSSDDVLHVFDAVEPNLLYELLEQKGHPRYIVIDSFTNLKLEENLNYYCFPFWLERECLFFTKEIKATDQIETNHCFNFQINKKQINRFLCMKLVEYFSLKDYDYTWSGTDSNFNMQDIITETQMLGSKSPVTDIGFFLGSVEIPKKWIEFSNNFSNNYQIKNYGGNAWVWNNGLNHIISHSAISLITESVRFQKGAIFSEKTMYACLGMTFPIWVGGYNQASEWKNMGFDIFDDVIDHSYQNYNTLFERCYYAFEKNLHLLKDKNLVAQLRIEHADRLKNNQKLIFTGAISDYLDRKMQNVPADLKPALAQIREYHLSS